MSKINILSSKIFNRIAAGEVVDRPYSIVKELVENAIDSGANQIEVEISNGGINSIVVSDNGCGIEKSDLPKALMPHATSKISSLKDLEAINTLGFRGEALPSIASVSKLTIESKTEEQVLGAKIYTEGGSTPIIEDCGCQKGTIVTVNNIFFNTPVREKFLRTPRSEEGEISSTMARFILGNPNISFKFVCDGEVVYQSFGDGLESALVNVYGPSVIKDCYYVDCERNGLHFEGYLGKHHFTKGNRSHQTTFINGRYVVNQTVSSAINNAYSSYLMKHRYPFYVLNISMPNEIVDINVHPNKLDVRFSNNQIVYGSLYTVVSKVLEGNSEVIKIVTQTSQQESTKVEIDSPSQKKCSNVKYSDFSTQNDFDLGKFVFHDSGAKPLEFKQENINKEKEIVDIFAENKAYLERLEQEKNKKLQDEQKQQISIDTKVQLNYIGQALNTFLIFEDGQDLYLVDQHAAHERILFDKLNLHVKNSDIPLQPLLIPYVLNVNNDEFDFLIQNVSSLQNIGLTIDEFGKNAFKIDAIPVFLSDINLENFFNDVLHDLTSLRQITVESVLKEKLAQKACKSAIKSGDKLDISEVKILQEKLNENIGLKCPHGRPVAVKITRTEIDKWFKRIV